MCNSQRGKAEKWLFIAVEIHRKVMFVQRADQEKVGFLPHINVHEDTRNTRTRVRGRQPEREVLMINHDAGQPGAVLLPSPPTSGGPPSIPSSDTSLTVCSRCNVCCQESSMIQSQNSSMDADGLTRQIHQHSILPADRI